MRRAVASCRGAITIMNAIPTGIGAAVGITLQTDAEVVIEEGENRLEIDLPERGEDDRLARECIAAVFDAIDQDVPNVRMRTRSTIPISRGLKSSSAAANAILLATIRAVEIDIVDDDLIVMGVEAAKRAGVTVTGAYDDATACYFGGIAITDNREMKVIRRCSIPWTDMRVILHVPQKKIRKSGISENTFSAVSEGFENVRDLVLQGDFFGAMTLNGALIAESLGLENNVADAAIDAGAAAAGISGTGPATAVICRRAIFDVVLDSIPHDDAVTITASLNETPAPEVSSWL